MSLLMDALKKAEEEKKRAAKQLKEVDDAPEGAEEAAGVDMQSLERTGSHEQASSGGKSQSGIDSLELTLAPLDGREDDSGAKPLVDTYDTIDITRGAQQEENATEKTRVEDIGFSEDMTLESTVNAGVPDESLEETKEAIDLDDTTIIEGLSADNNTGAPFDDTFHGVILDDDDAVYEETLPGVSADQLAKDLGGGVYQPTPVAAKTVFSATAKNKKSNSFKWGIFSILVLLAITSFAVFYYFSITPVARKMPSPDVARGVETTPAAIPALPAVESDEVSGTLIAATQDPVENGTVNDIADEAETTETDVAMTEPVEEVQQAEVEGTTAVDPELAEETMNEVSPQPAGVSQESSETTPVTNIVPVEAQDKQIADTGKEKTQTLPEYIELDQRAVQISKNVQSESKMVLLKQGFSAFNNGDMTLAKSLYQDALKLQSDNRDARLGLAAIALKMNDRQEALKHYVFLLKQDPDDALALTGMQNLYQNSDPIRNQSAIKLLLQREGEQPYLYFNLGNAYARQQRWPEAQQAFFDAFRLDNDNADYALNLAISLDHMEQYRSALDYYQSALTLAADNNVNLDFATIQKRITTLSSIIQEKL